MQYIYDMIYIYNSIYREREKEMIDFLTYSVAKFTKIFSAVATYFYNMDSYLLPRT